MLDGQRGLFRSFPFFSDIQPTSRERTEDAGTGPPNRYRTILANTRIHVYGRFCVLKRKGSSTATVDPITDPNDKTEKARQSHGEAKASDNIGSLASSRSFVVIALLSKPGARL